MPDLTLSDLAQEKLSSEIFVAVTPEQNLGDILGLHDEATKKNGNYVVYRYLGMSAESLDLSSSTFILVDKGLDESQKIPTKKGFSAYSLRLPIGARLKAATVNWSIFEVGKQAGGGNDLEADNRSRLELINGTTFETGLGRTLRIVWSGDVDGGYQGDSIGVEQGVERRSRGVGNGNNFRNFQLDVYREKDGIFLPAGSITVPVYNGPLSAGRSSASFRTYFATTGEVVLYCDYTVRGEPRRSDISVFARDDW
ncbi:MAG TPA: hypothetical protein VE954_09725 [Oligoflexus sp.]|uniref:hypothetical protein n=1 Tax=Oligoflexus sp. TaxID=1971216 RepID=UPI002D26F774|nr:hypothetical protein [Oligoflexus sp.]HYX33380.1 hypothetical protein [Oligoflexus sp.]